MSKPINIYDIYQQYYIHTSICLNRAEDVSKLEILTFPRIALFELPFVAFICIPVCTPETHQ